jgi:pimeloyl-ACP methyl ester carboxylesterase
LTSIGTRDSGSERFVVQHGELSLAGERWQTASERGVVVMLHGGGQTRHSWSGTARRLSARGWTTIAMDLRGHGETDWAPDGDYTLTAFSGDLEALLRGLDEPAVLVGASLGGAVSLWTAAVHPALVRALVLVDVVVSLEREGVDRIVEFMTSRPDGFASLEDAATAIAAYTPDRDRPPNPQGLRKNLRQRGNGRWYWHWDPAFLARDDRTRRAMTAGRMRDVAAQVSVPTLLLRGGHSDVVSQAGIDDMLELIPHAEAADVTEAGHMIAGDDNDIFTARLDDFLGRLPPAQPAGGAG